MTREVSPYGTNSVDVTDTSPGQLHRTVWRFTYFDGCLNLRRYAQERRATRRHKWRAETLWEDAGGRDNTTTRTVTVQ